MREVAIGITLANVDGSVNLKQVYSFIEEQSGDIETYEMAPARPGTIRAAAIDYILLLRDIGNVASVAGILWKAYDHFIAPKKRGSDNSGIVVILKKDDGAVDQFWIGNTDNCKEVFVEDFSHKVETIRHSKANGESTEHMIEEVRTKSLWVRRK